MLIGWHQTSGLFCRVFSTALFATILTITGCGDSSSEDTTEPQQNPPTKSALSDDTVSIGDPSPPPENVAANQADEGPTKGQQIPLPPRLPSTQDKVAEQLEKMEAKVEKNKNDDVVLVSFAGLEVGDEHLKLLAPLTYLRTLDLTDTQVTDKGLKNLDGLAYLTNLYLLGTDVTGSGLSDLQHLPRLEHVCLDETLVSDESLPQVVTLKRLSTLHLETRAKITDKGAKLLKNLKDLRELKITGTDISPEMRDELSKALPDMKFVDSE